MTAPAIPEVESVEQLLTLLEPPCECLDDGRPCTAAAQWIIRMFGKCEHPNPNLACEHHQQVVAGCLPERMTTVCQVCGETTRAPRVTFERIRSAGSS